MDDDFDDDQTPGERNAAYLRANPAMEGALWQDWVQVVCRREGIALPNAEEWDALKARWHHDKWPLHSVEELKAMRAAAARSAASTSITTEAGKDSTSTGSKQ